VDLPGVGCGFSFRSRCRRPREEGGNRTSLRCALYVRVYAKQVFAALSPRTERLLNRPKVAKLASACVDEMISFWRFRIGLT